HRCCILGRPDRLTWTQREYCELLYPSGGFQLDLGRGEFREGIDCGGAGIALQPSAPAVGPVSILGTDHLLADAPRRSVRVSCLRLGGDASTYLRRAAHFEPGSFARSDPAGRTGGLALFG